MGRDPMVPHQRHLYFNKVLFHTVSSGDTIASVLGRIEMPMAPEAGDEIGDKWTTEKIYQRWIVPNGVLG